jgi:hypothetical protein
MYTTVEGLVEKILANIRDIPFGTGDSAEGDESHSSLIDKACAEIQKVCNFIIINFS